MASNTTCSLHNHALIDGKVIKNLQRTQEWQMKKQRPLPPSARQPPRPKTTRRDRGKNITDRTEHKFQNIQLETRKYLLTMTQGGLVKIISWFLGRGRRRDRGRGRGQNRGRSQSRGRNSQN